METSCSRCPRRTQGRTTRPERDRTTREALDGVRRKYSVTWKENLPWAAGQILIFVLAILAATFLAIFVPSLALGVLRDPFASPWPIIGFCLSIGLILGSVGSLPR